MDDAYILGWDIVLDDVQKSDSKRLKLALQKRNILAKEIGRLHRVVSSIKRDSESKQSYVGDKFKLLEDDPFIRFYLRVYRELCGKTDIQDISNEALERWSSKKRKPRLPIRKRRANASKLCGAVWELVLREKSLRDIPRKERDKLKMALIKNKIVAEEVAKLTRFVRKIRHEKKSPSTFIKIYLNVFRELCGNSSEQEIKGEAIKIWSKTKKKTEESRGGCGKGCTKGCTKSNGSANRKR